MLCAYEGASKSTSSSKPEPSSLTSSLETAAAGAPRETQRSISLR
ncbi:MAG: hypothetical protein R2748_29855 [Bryobacterales bacterium]